MVVILLLSTQESAWWWDVTVLGLDYDSDVHDLPMSILVKICPRERIRPHLDLVYIIVAGLTAVRALLQELKD